METPDKAVQFELTLDDYRAMLRHVCRSGTSERIFWFVAVFLASFTLATFGIDGRLFLTGVVIGFFLFLVKTLLLQHRLQPRAGGSVLCHYDIRLAPDGARVQTPRWTAHMPWHGIAAVEETAAHYFLRIDTPSAYAIPKRAFADAAAAQDFADFARAALARARASSKASS